MDSIQRVQLQCLSCKTWFFSPIQFSNAHSFDTSMLAGNLFGCPTCRAFVPCNKENMRWVRSDGKGGFVGVDTDGPGKLG
jgi:hypothetical protein